MFLFCLLDYGRRTGFTLWPTEISLYSYELLFRSPDQMIGAYAVTVGLTLVGTVIGLFVIAMTGYALQRKDFPFRNGIMFYIYFTSLFSAGLVPFYLLIVQTLKPVSYTHLDVYKRQGGWRNTKRRRITRRIRRSRSIRRREITTWRYSPRMW